MRMETKHSHPGLGARQHFKSCINPRDVLNGKQDRA